VVTQANKAWEKADKKQKVCHGPKHC